MAGNAGGSDLRTRAILSPVMLAIIVGIYWLDVHGTLGVRVGVLSAVLLGLLGLGAAVEYVRLLAAGGFPVGGPILLTATTLLLGSSFLFEWRVLDHHLLPLLVSTLLVLFLLAVRSLSPDGMQEGLERQGASLLGFVWIAWPLYLAMGMCLHHLPSVLFVVLVSKGGDIGGYCVGRLIGRHKLILHISPGKTVEGAVGSLAGSLLIAVLLHAPLSSPRVELSLPWLLLAGLVLNFTTQAGDLVESLLKRRCNQKDSSRLVPAHGGVLDLIDSLLFSFGAWFSFLAWIT